MSKYFFSADNKFYYYDDKTGALVELIEKPVRSIKQEQMRIVGEVLQGKRTCRIIDEPTDEE